MAADLAGTPVSGITAQLCGDAHLSNFGLFGTLEAGTLLNLVRQQVDVKQLGKKEARRAEKHVAQAYGNDSTRVFAKRTAEVGGELRIRAHARSGDRIAIASYLGQGDAFDRAIADFSAAYADQNERDFEAFTAAVSFGRLTAQTGL